MKTVTRFSFHLGINEYYIFETMKIVCPKGRIRRFQRSVDAS